MKKQLSKDEVKHIAKLANLNLTEGEIAQFQIQLSSILDLVSQLQKVNTKDILPTFQVTGLVNVFREDEIDSTRTLTQESALANAKRKYKGFFVVPAIFE